MERVDSEVKLLRSTTSRTTKLVRRSQSVLAVPGKITPTSLTLNPGLPYEEWERVGGTLRTIESGVQSDSARLPRHYE